MNYHNYFLYKYPECCNDIGQIDISQMSKFYKALEFLGKWLNKNGESVTFDDFNYDVQFFDKPENNILYRKFLRQYKLKRILK